MDEIAGHIAEARAGARARDRGGSYATSSKGSAIPADIAVDARERFDVRPTSAAAPYKPGWIEVGALVMLLVGGLIVPIVGWFVGVVLLWVSNAWNVRDKVIGTLFVPGGLGPIVLPALRRFERFWRRLQRCFGLRNRSWHWTRVQLHRNVDDGPNELNGCTGNRVRHRAGGHADHHDGLSHVSPAPPPGCGGGLGGEPLDVAGRERHDRSRWSAASEQRPDA